MAGLKRAVLINDTRVDKHHGCDRVVSAIFSSCKKVGIEIVATSPAHSDWMANTLFRTALETADLIVVNGEGTIHHNRAAGKRLLAAGEFAREKQIPAALINCTWQANDDAALKALSNFSLVSVRESRSESAVKAQGVQSLRAPDLSFEGLAWRDGSRHGIAVADSVVRSDQRRLYAILRMAKGARACSIMYPPEGWLGKYRFCREYVAARDFLDPLTLRDLVRFRLEQLQAATRDGDAFLQNLASVELLIGGRFHATCLAMGLGTPFLAIRSNSHKIEGLLTDAGLESRLIEPGQLSQERLTGASRWAPEEKRTLVAFLEDGAQRRHRLFEKLRGVCK